MRPFLVCVHDATPAHAHETRVIIRDLAPLVGRRLSFAVVPDWLGAWPLSAHPGYCRLLKESAEELLLHGYLHRRRRGRGPVSWLAEDSDEMNGLDAGETRATLARAQGAFTDAFGKPARGFLAPAWQRGRVIPGEGSAPGVEHVLGFFSLDSATGRKVPLATSTWDCGRWGCAGHLGHGIGWVTRWLGRGVPTLAIHPRDLERGYWPAIVNLVRDLLDSGHEPRTATGLLESPC